MNPKSLFSLRYNGNEPRLNSEKRRILLVDDDESIVYSFQVILRDQGYEVDAATTGLQALEKAEEKDYHTVLLDIRLPDIQGIEVAKRLKEKDEDINVVIMTGYPDLGKSIDAIDIGVHEILMKPIEPNELIRVIRETTECAR